MQAADTTTETHTDTDTNEESQPDPSTDPARTYIRVRPADDPLSTAAATTQFRRLHSLAPTDGGLLDRLWGDDPPTVEWLVVSHGADDRIAYYVGIEDPDHLDALERLLRTLFPDSYELDRTDWHPRRLDAQAATDNRPDHDSGARQATSADAAHSGDTAHTDDDSDPSYAAVEFRGRATRRRDWQLPLTPFATFQDDDAARVPVASIVEAMADAAVPMVYQVLCRPMADWSSTRDDRVVALEASQDTIRDQVVNVIAGPPDTTDERPIPASDETRCEQLAERDPSRSFVVAARVLAVGTPTATADPRPVCRDLRGAFGDVSGRFHTIEGVLHTGAAAAAVATAIRERTLPHPSYERLRTHLPWTANTSPGIVMDATELPSLCLLAGPTLTAAGARAVGPRTGERTAVPRPPVEHLERYGDEGLLVGHPLTQDGAPAPDPIAVPPTLQPLHVLWAGKTGAGKSTALGTAISANHQATDGADIIIVPKGGGMATDYLRTHYAQHGDLDDVLYFDCSEVLPAFAFFDIRDELVAGIPRTTAVEDRVDHYVEILAQIMGRERFEQAVRSPDVLRYLVKAMFDPVNGQDAFSHRDLHEQVRRMHEHQTAPPVSDDDLERMLGGVVENRARTFDEVMQGVANRIEKIPADRRLARIFNHVPDDDDDPHFDLAEYLDEDVVIIFDTGGLRTEAQRVLTLVVLSNLWTALRRRQHRSDREDHPLVNCYIEEAASVATSDLLQELLAQARGFDAALTLAMQFPGQVREGDTTVDVYDELLNNVSTIITGNVPADRGLARRLATDDMNAEAVANRLRALRRGEWLVSLPAAFGAPEPRPFLCQSMAPPSGHPASDQPLTGETQAAFERAVEACRERTRDTAGVTLSTGSGVDSDDGAEEPAAGTLRVDSALPHTQRLPPTVTYDPEMHGLQCTECYNRYDPDSQGMVRAIECCSSLDSVDRDDIPLTAINLKLTPEERAESGWSDRQLMFLQVVYNAQQLRYDDPEYDLLRDSMIRLQEYVGIDSEAVQELIDAGLLRHDTDHPHRLYTVTPEGRGVIGESYRLGVDYGHGQGDLEESSLHVLAVEVGRRYVEQEYVENPDSPVAEVVPYYDLDERNEPVVPAAAAMGGDESIEAADPERRRLDVAGLDADGEVVVAVEAERVNHDYREAVPADFDKMAAVEPSEAIWIVMTRQDGHEVLQVLNDPPDGQPRVEKTYAESTPPQQVSVETPGLTAIYPVAWLRDQLK